MESSIQSTKTRPGADCDSDHELLIAKFRLKLKKVGKTTRSFRYDLSLNYISSINYLSISYLSNLAVTYMHILPYLANLLYLIHQSSTYVSIYACIHLSVICPSSVTIFLARVCSQSPWVLGNPAQCPHTAAQSPVSVYDP